MYHFFSLQDSKDGHPLARQSSMALPARRSARPMAQACPATVPTPSGEERGAQLPRRTW